MASPSVSPSKSPVLRAALGASMSPPRARMAVLLVSLLMMQACSHLPLDASDTVRQTSFGPVQGTHEGPSDGTYSWKGVPFASPPVNELRWQAPVDPLPWTSVRPATQFANAC